MKQQKYITILSALICSGMFISCGDDNGIEVNIGQTQVGCENDSDCASGKVCDNGKCKKPQTGCETDADCTDSKVCKDGKCSTPKCSSDDECKSGQTCDNGKCVMPKCTSDDECQSGQTCQDGVCKSTGIPSDDECLSSADCDPGFVCQGGQCKAVTTECQSDSECTDGKHCSDDKKCVSGDANKDTDGDGISDEYDRCDEDTDGDTIPNCEDSDSDGDGIPDSVESGTDGSASREPVDSDGDGLYDFMDTDSDDNGIPDSVETGADPTHPVDTDGDGIPDYIDLDNDGDGVGDEDEIAGIVVMYKGEIVPGRLCNGVRCEAGTPDNPWDTDGDTIPDYMDDDSDNDGLKDSFEGKNDSDLDGVLDRYTQDSDGDGVKDGDEVDANGELLKYQSEDGNTVYCYRTPDCDGDALSDKDEVMCNGVSTALVADADGDGYLDGAEYIAAKYAMEHPDEVGGMRVSSVEDLVCNPDVNVKSVFEFYFVLPYGGEKQQDDLVFTPSVQKLDVVFNVDTTGSMGSTIDNVKTNISATITSLKQRVADSGVGLTNFDDFPVGADVDGEYVPYGDSSSGDLPFRVLGRVSDNISTVMSYVNNQLFDTRNGADGPESGAESLYQIATGEGVSWNSGSLSYGAWIFEKTYNWNAGKVQAVSNTPGTWGGVGWRDGALPVVIHTTDIFSHDQNTSQYPLQGKYGTISSPISSSYATFSSEVNIPYNSSYIPNAHYTPQLIPKLQEKGIRVITLNVSSNGSYMGDALGQMTMWARESNAIVPACAFENCAANKCCLGSETTNATTINGHPNQCVLAYKAAHTDVSKMVVQGVDALVKYGTYDVATRVTGEDIPGTSVKTDCFIEAVEATKYEPPALEPEKSCNPVAVPTAVGASSYKNGFSNFAPGTSSANRTGARLHFTVNASNHCVNPSNESQVFTAYIEVYNPTTGLSFGTRKVSILVPPGEGEVEVN